jgi:hypothetical protein
MSKADDLSARLDQLEAERLILTIELRNDSLAPPSNSSPLPSPKPSRAEKSQAAPRSSASFPAS